MTLKDIVPPMKLCKQIPAGKFEDSALVWSSGYIKGNYVISQRGYGCGYIAPAPTLQEIMKKLPKHVEYWWYNGKFCPCHPKYDPEDFSDKTPATAALKLWLELERGGK